MVDLLSDLEKADFRVLAKARTMARMAMKVAAVLKESRDLELVLAELLCSLEDIKAPSMVEFAIFILVFGRAREHSKSIPKLSQR